MIYLFVILSSYALGSIPFGLVITRLAGLGDIRKIGSANIGATNVLRTGRRELAILTLLADLMKAGGPTYICMAYGRTDLALAAALSAFLGHLFPIWLGFRGGKGVASFVGILLALHWPSALIFAVLWIACVLIFRFSSLAALVGSLAQPLILGLLFNETDKALLVAVLAILIWYSHRENIARLIAGTENKLQLFSLTATTDDPHGRR